MYSSCEDGSIVQEIPLAGAPWDAYIESDGRTLVTIPDEDTIVVLQESTLAVEKTIKLSCACRGIAKRQDKYLIGTGGTIEEFNLDFNHHKSRVKDITNDIAVDNDDCVVFGHYSYSKITKVDPYLNYKKIFVYDHRQLLSPHGLTMDNNGFIFMNDIEEGKIHILSEDGSLSKIFDIDSPQCIRFKNQSQKFFVANSKGVVKIFETTW